jgi:hypothetical protein
VFSPFVESKGKKTPIISPEEKQGLLGRWKGMERGKEGEIRRLMGGEYDQSTLYGCVRVSW